MSRWYSVRTRASVILVNRVAPTEPYTSMVQLEYDALLRLKKSIQVYD